MCYRAFQNSGCSWQSYFKWNKEKISFSFLFFSHGSGYMWTLYVWQQLYNLDVGCTQFSFVIRKLGGWSYHETINALGEMQKRDCGNAGMNIFKPIQWFRYLIPRDNDIKNTIVMTVTIKTAQILQVLLLTIAAQTAVRAATDCYTLGIVCSNSIATWRYPRSFVVIDLSHCPNICLDRPRKTILLCMEA
jgi:hypothetical protein